MAPVTGVFVNDADVNFLALQVPQVDCDALQLLGCALELGIEGLDALQLLGGVLELGILGGTLR